MQVPNRFYNGSDYRYGFQGQEKDNEIKGEGNSLNYTFRMHDPRIGRFFAPDPLTPKYPYYSPYQFSGNRVIDMVELEGLEPARAPSFLEHGYNMFFSPEINRMKYFMTKHNIDQSNITELPNETYVVTQVYFDAIDMKHRTIYNVFRRNKIPHPFYGLGMHYGSDNDDIGLSEEKFLDMGNVVGGTSSDAPLPAVGTGKAVTSGVVQMVNKSKPYLFRQVVSAVEKGAKVVKNWKSEIRFGIADISGISKDVLTKGFHVHFEKLKGLELGIVPAGDKLALNFIAGGQAHIQDAVKIFNGAMSDQNFRKSLLIRLKATKEALLNHGLKNVSEIKAANDKGIEVDRMIKILTKMD